jgi:UDP-glucose 4-epimerase
MRILVTGGAGFTGTNLIKRLLRDGHEVVSVDNYSTGKKENHQEGCRYYENDLSSDRILGIYVDYGSYPSWRDDEYDIIFHLAALARIQPSFEDPVKTFKSNIAATMNILELARKKDVPVVYAGSSSAHGDLHANPYTFTKWQGEEMCNLYYKVFAQPVAICRFYNVYGPHQVTEGDYCNVLGIFERKWKNNQPLTVTGDGEQRRDFTHVDDIVQGLIKCGYRLTEDHHTKDVSGQIFELGRGVNYSINELVEAFGETDVEYLPAYPGEMRETLNIDTKAQEVLGWKPEYDIIDYIKKTFRKDNDG